MSTRVDRRSFLKVTAAAAALGTAAARPVRSAAQDKRTLVVANQTVDSRDLIETLKKKGAEGEHQFFVILPQSGSEDNDEEAADKQIAAREPKLQRGGAEQGRRGRKDAKPLMRIDELAPGLLADQIIGMEVRSSDDKIVGEVRNIVFGTKDRRDYAIVASGGFFTPGKDSIVVPIQSLKVSQERVSFFLPITKETMTKVPLMPDQDYKWLSDKKWRAHNDAIFRGKVNPPS